MHTDFPNMAETVAVVVVEDIISVVAQLMRVK